MAYSSCIAQPALIYLFILYPDLSYSSFLSFQAYFAS